MPLFFSMFKTLEGKAVMLELKNGLQLRGKLVSVDQYLNMKLDEIEVVDRENYPQLVGPQPRARAAGARRATVAAPLLPLLAPISPAPRARARPLPTPTAPAALCALPLCARRRGAIRDAAPRRRRHGSAAGCLAEGGCRGCQGQAIRALEKQPGGSARPWPPLVFPAARVRPP